MTGLVAFAAIAPSVLVYIPAGVLVDRWNPRRVMLVSELLRGLAIVFVVASLAICGRHINICWLITAMVSEEILEIFSTLADRRYLSGLMESENMASRQASIEVRAHAVVLAGRPIGPFLFAINWLLPFLADAISFVFSVVILLVLRASNEPARPPQRMHIRQMRSDIRQGFGWLRKDRRATITTLLMAATSLVCQALIMIFLAEAHSRQLSTVAIGVVLAASGAGGAIGSVCARFLPDRVKGGAWLPIQMLTWTLALAFLTLAGGPSPACSAIAMLILGFTGAVGNIEFGTYLVASVGDDMIARVTSIGQMLTIGAAAFGPVLGGAAIQEYGVQRAIEILLFLVVLLLASCSFMRPEITRPVTRARSSIARTLRMTERSVTVAAAMVGSTLADRGAATLQSVRMRWQFPMAPTGEESRRKRVFLGGTRPTRLTIK
jgi:MFS family permease